MEGFRKIPGSGGSEGGSYVSHVPKFKDSCFFCVFSAIYGNISFCSASFLCRLDRLIQHHDPDDHLS